jgi:hypothetical protein
MWQCLELAAVAAKEARWLTRERLLRWGAACAFATIGVLAMNVAGHTMTGLTNAAGEHLGRDFVQFWSSARLAVAGRPEAAYVLGAPYHTADQVFAYPPIVMLLCWPLAGLSYAHALLAWGSLGLALCAWALSRLVGWEMAVLASIATPAAFINVFLQQNGFYTAGLLACGLMLVERRPVSSGILLGLLCYKPQLSVLLCPALIAGGHWRVLLWVAATALVLAATSALLFGPDTWIAFFARMAVQRQFLESRVAAWPWMTSVFATMRLVGASSPASYLIQGLSTLSAAIAVVALWRWRCPHGVKCAGLAVATFLATPYAWDYDAVVLTFAAAWLANEAVRAGFRPWEKITVFVWLTLPALSLIPAKLLNFQIAPILLWLSLAVVMRHGLSLRSPRTTALVESHSG